MSPTYRALSPETAYLRHREPPSGVDKRGESARRVSDPRWYPFPYRGQSVPGRPAVTLVAYLLVASCSPGDQADANDLSAVPQARIILTEVQTFGAPDDSLESFPAGGPLLAQIAEAVESPDEAVYVLDAGFKKIAVFNKDGSVRRVILGGHGQGPREFLHPTSLTLDPRGRLAVFDYSQNRVTVFDTAGALLTTITTRRARDILLFNDTIWGAYMPGATHHLWSVPLSGEGNAVDRIPLDDHHKNFSPTGVISLLGRDLRNRPLVAHQRPGLLFSLGPGGRFEQLGTEILPGARHIVYQDILVPPGATWGIGQLASGEYALLYETRQLTDSDLVSEYYLAVLDSTGMLRAQLDLGAAGAQVTSFSSSWDGRYLYMTRYEPFPQVVKYTISIEE